MKFQTYSVPVQIPEGDADASILPFDKRHRWQYMNKDVAGNSWYRCSACRKRRKLVSLVNMLSRGMRAAEFNLRATMARQVYAR